MVYILSSHGDGARYETPLMNILSFAPQKLASSPPKTQLGAGLDEFLKANGYEGKKIGSTESYAIGLTNPQTMFAMPAILQHTYDHIKTDDQPPLSFMVSLALHYVDDNGITREFKGLYDAEAINDIELKKNLSEFFIKHEGPRLKKFESLLIVTSPESEVKLPAAQMTHAIKEAQQDMMDQTRYKLENFDGEGDKSTDCFMIENSMADLSTKLLPIVAHVYGAQTQIMLDDNGIETLAIPASHFHEIRAHEVPGRGKSD